MQNIINQLHREVEKHITNAGVSKLIVGLSGGADSTALLRLLDNLDIRLVAVHCNFHLRGEESNRDMAFCQNLCNKLNISLNIVHFDVPAYMAEHNISGIEEACRILRYDYFRSLKLKFNADRIAVAHNNDDNIETLLLNLFRGAGIKGLKGMLPDSGEIIRPLINIPRSSILDYLNELGQDYIIDSSNLSNTFRRNLLRNEIIPTLESTWPGVKKAISHSIHSLQLDYKMLNHISDRDLEKILGSNPNELHYESLAQYYNPEWLIFKWVSQFKAPSNISSEIAEALSSSRNITGKNWITPTGNIYASYNSLIFIPRITDNHETTVQQCSINELCEIKVHENSHDLLKKIISQPDNSVLWTDLSPHQLLVRHIQTADRIDSLGCNGSQLVSKVLKDAKIPAYLRRKTIIVAHGDQILWIPRLRRSRHNLISPETPTIYQYTLKSRLTNIC